MKESFRFPAIVFIVIISVVIIVTCNKADTPVLKIINIDYITSTTATVYVSLSDDGGAAVTSRGVCWSTSANPGYTDNKTSEGKGEGMFSSSISPLTPETTYYVKAYATNSEGIGYSERDTFRTTSTVPPPEIMTTLISYTTNEAHIHCNILNEGGAMVTVSGICWSTSQDPDITDDNTTDGVNDGEYASLMPNLTANTKYFVKAYATTILGTYYGNEISFTTLSESDGKVYDIEGNFYNVVNIGTQRWTAENLKTKTLNNGVAIPIVEDYGMWSNHKTPACCYYLNSEYYKNPYGLLYNFYAVETGTLCPAGWHVPSSDEYTILVNYLGGDSIAGGKLKETGLSHWKSPNEGATNESGFSAVPGGGRDTACVIWGFPTGHCLLGESAYIWTSSYWVDGDYTSYVGWGVGSGDRWARTEGASSKLHASSVRCLKDNQPR